MLFYYSQPGLIPETIFSSTLCVFLLGQSTIRTALIMIGKNEHCQTATDIKDWFEDSQDGRIEVNDFEQVHKSGDSGKGETFDVKLQRYLSQSTGILVICSEELKSCINNKSVVDITVNGVKVSLNGELVLNFLEEGDNKSKVIPLSGTREHLPTCLESNTCYIEILGDDINEDRLEMICTEIRGKLEEFHSK